MIVSNHRIVYYSYNPSDNRRWRHEKRLTELLCLSCTCVCPTQLQWFQLQLLQMQRKLPSEPKKACVLKDKKSCVLAVEHQMKVLAAVQDLALPVRETDLRGHHLGVGVATAHFLVILKMGVQIPFLKLAHSHVSMLVDLPMNKNRNSEVGCVWNHKI